MRCHTFCQAFFMTVDRPFCYETPYKIYSDSQTTRVPQKVP
jgi:hypothetical protein